MQKIESVCRSVDHLPSLQTEGSYVDLSFVAAKLSEPKNYRPVSLSLKGRINFSVLMAYSTIPKGVVEMIVRGSQKEEVENPQDEILDVDLQESQTADEWGIDSQEFVVL